MLYVCDKLVAPTKLQICLNLYFILTIPVVGGWHYYVYLLI